jgi:hypothetical protein
LYHVLALIAQKDCQFKLPVNPIGGQFARLPFLSPPGDPWSRKGRQNDPWGATLERIRERKATAGTRFAQPVWELRANVTSYDAWYVAVAEQCDLPLATLDQRLARATGPRCRFHLPPSS